jgi:hypothetical protein
VISLGFSLLTCGIMFRFLVAESLPALTFHIPHAVLTELESYGFLIRRIAVCL